MAFEHPKMGATHPQTRSKQPASQPWLDAPEDFRKTSGRSRFFQKALFLHDLDNFSMPGGATPEDFRKTLGGCEGLVRTAKGGCEAVQCGR